MMNEAEEATKWSFDEASNKWLLISVVVLLFLVLSISIGYNSGLFRSVHVFANNQDKQQSRAEKFNNEDVVNSLPMGNAGIEGKTIQVAAGRYHYLVLTDKGNVYSLGNNRFGQLAQVHNANSDIINMVPHKITGFVGKPIQVAVGEFHSLVLTDKGKVYSFGDNQYGQLGRAENAGIEEKPNALPKMVSGFVGKPIQIVAGDYHSLILTDGGRVYSFGDNIYGQLGRVENAGLYAPNALPKMVAGMEGKPIRIAAHKMFSLVFTDSGKVYSFGNKTI